MGKLTERGEIVAAGGSALADATGDDTLRPLDQSDARDASSDVETERQDPADSGTPADAPGPADIPPAPVVENADDADAAARENR
jgi:hypothetical protein